MNANLFIFLGILYAFKALILGIILVLLGFFYFESRLLTWICFFIGWFLIIFESKRLLR
jgi:hypothetical protein